MNKSLENWTKKKRECTKKEGRHDFHQQTWGQSGAHSLQVGQGGDGLLHVGQLSESFATFRLHGLGGVDAHQIGQLWKKFATLQKPVIFFVVFFLNN